MWHVLFKSIAGKLRIAWIITHKQKYEHIVSNTNIWGAREMPQFVKYEDLIIAITHMLL